MISSFNATSFVYLMAGIAVGVLTMYAVFNYVLRRNTKQTNDFWRTMCLSINNEWGAFHKESLFRLEKDYQEAIIKAITERDRQWRNAQAGNNSTTTKPKPPSN